MLRFADDDGLPVEGEVVTKFMSGRGVGRSEPGLLHPAACRLAEDVDRADVVVLSIGADEQVGPGQRYGMTEGVAGFRIRLDRHGLCLGRARQAPKRKQHDAA